jgi:hypothetical protein
MATEIYKIENVQTIDGLNIEIHPLKIKYMRQFMDRFYDIGDNMSEEQMIDILCDCVRISMKQYAPQFSKSIEDVQDNFDIKTVYDILDFAAGIKINREKKKEEVQSNSNSESLSWKDLDLVKLETEIFLLGIWKSYDELETSISIQELFATISSSRELDYEEKRFLAAIQGVKLDGDPQDEGRKKWEDMKARVFSGGATNDSKDILALQGYNAQKLGFGIGMGIDYEDLRTPSS